MRHIHQEVIVAAPIDHVFGLACQVERQPEWNPYMELTGITGPIDTVGTTFSSTLRLLGQRFESKGTVVEAERPKLIHIRGMGDNGAHSDWVYRFEPYGSGTLCSLDVEYETPGALPLIMDLLVYHAALDRATRHMAENFAALAMAKVPQAI
jgi:Polyketide cyclase / dehydrase and lipid transport